MKIKPSKDKYPKQICLGHAMEYPDFETEDISIQGVVDAIKLIPGDIVIVATYKLVKVEEVHGAQQTRKHRKLEKAG